MITYLLSLRNITKKMLSLQIYSIQYHMLMKTFKSILTFIFCLFALATAAQQSSVTVDLWQGKLPNENGDKNAKTTMQVFLPDAETATGRAIVICPGGAYGSLSVEFEGTAWAPMLNNMGIAAIVLSYRMPYGNPEVPISDAEQAIRFVRANAKNWHVNANDVGVMGFSAGGHLASTIATHSKGEAKPDFQALFYPVITMDPSFSHKQSHDNFLGSSAKKKNESEYSSDQQVTRSTPRAFIALSDDDQTVLPINGVNYYVELYRHDVPASLHVYPGGGHGWGMHTTFRYHAEMLLDFAAWLRSF
jgi:acetyl esterase/lipase